MPTASRLMKTTMNKKATNKDLTKKQAVIIVIVGTVLGIAVVIGAPMMNKYHPDVLEKILIGLMVTSSLFCLCEIFNPFGYGPSGGSGSSSANTGGDEAEPAGSRWPVGKVPVPYDPSRGFTDYYGHEYYKLGDTWFDDNGCAAPDHMKDRYGLTCCEDEHNDL